VELLAGFEADGFSWGDADFRTGSGIAPDAGLAGLYGEDAEAAQFNAIAGDEGLFHAFEDGIHGSFCLGPRKPGPFDDALDEILLNQEIPFACGA
jgi:hypothetical protein